MKFWGKSTYEEQAEKQAEKKIRKINGQKGVHSVMKAKEVNNFRKKNVNICLKLNMEVKYFKD